MISRTVYTGTKLYQCIVNLLKIIILEEVERLTENRVLTLETDEVLMLSESQSVWNSLHKIYCRFKSIKVAPQLVILYLTSSALFTISYLGPDVLFLFVLRVIAGFVSLILIPGIVVSESLLSEKIRGSDERFKAAHFGMRKSC